MSKKILSICWILFSLAVNCQDQYSDSLLILIRIQKEDSVKVRLLNTLSRYNARQLKITDAKRYAEEARNLAKSNGYTQGIREANISFGGIYNSQANNFMSKHRYSDGLNHYLEALKIYEKNAFKTGIAGVSGNIGRLYWIQGNYSEATKYYLLAMKIFEELKDRNGIANISNNIGLIYENQGNYTEALKYYDLAIRSYNDAGNQQALINLYFNIGFLYEDQGKYEEALKHHQIALGISEEAGSKNGIAASYANIGDIYKKQKKYDDALNSYLKTLKLFRELDTKDGVSLALSDVGTAYYNLKDYTNAKLHLQEGLSVAKEEGLLYQIRLIYQLLYSVDSANANWEESLKNYKQYINYKDSIQGEDVKNNLVKAKMQYDFDKQADSMKYQQTLTDEKLKRQILLNRQHEQDLRLRENEVALLYQEKQYQHLEVQKDSIAFAAHKIEAARKLGEFELLAREKSIQDLELKREKLLKIYFFAGLILLLAVAFFAYRNNRNRQKLKLQLLRNKIASDLHDDIGSTLSSILIFSQMAQQQPKEVTSLLEKIEDNSRKMLDSMGDIVWTVHSENDQFDKIILRMSSFAYELLGARNIDFEFLADEQVAGIRLPMDVRRNLYLIFKEATNNMVKYSNAKKAVFNIREERNNLVIQIIDYGDGFDVSKSTSGNGLKNMRKRAEEIDAKLIIESNPGKGTLIELRMAI